MDASRRDKLISVRESVELFAERLDRMIHNRHTMMSDEEQYDRLVTAYCALSFDFGKLYNAK